jgi:hypothetical protein
VLRYLGRYTRRIAIPNHRLLAFDGERVTFRYKDYARDGKQRIMTLRLCPKCGGPMCVARRLTAAELSLLSYLDSS